jgi:hypothetical protein
MILVDLITEIFLAAGPYFLFGGMGSGTQSGKLLFKQLCEGDSSITLTENLDSITIDSNVPNTNTTISSCEIVYGTGTGITSSFAKVSGGDKQLLGISSIGTLTFSSGWGVCDASGVPTSCNSLIISSYNVDNLNYKGRNSNILGSAKSKICCSCETDIIGSQNSNFNCSSLSSIVTSINVTSSTSFQSTIIGGYNSQICNSCYASIISGSNNIINYTSNINKSKTCGNSIISSNLSCIKSNSTKSGSINSFNSILSSNNSFIVHTNPGGSGKGTTQSIELGLNSIISSDCSYICGAIYNKSKLYSCGSDTSVIISTIRGKIVDSCRSSIISGCCNSIILSLTGSADVMSTANIQNVSIIGGKNNNICLFQDVDKHTATISIANSGIISSKGITFSEANNRSIRQFSVISSADLNLPGICNINSSIIGSRSTKSVLMTCVCHSAVINSCSNATNAQGIVWRSCRAVLLNTEDSDIQSSIDSVIVNGSMNSFPGISCRSVIVSGCCNSLYANNSVILSGYKNYTRGCNSIISAGGCNTICDGSKDSIIFSGFKNTVCDYQNAIVSSACSYIGSSDIFQKEISTVIIGGCKNCIISNSQNSSIIGGCNNCIVGLSFSAIIGSSDKGLTGSFHNTLYVSKLIFDLPAYAGGSTAFAGLTTTLTASWSFKVRNGLIIVNI